MNAGSRQTAAIISTAAQDLTKPHDQFDHGLTTGMVKGAVSENVCFTSDTWHFIVKMFCFHLIIIP